MSYTVMDRIGKYVSVVHLAKVKRSKRFLHFSFFFSSSSSRQRLVASSSSSSSSSSSETEDVDDEEHRHDMTGERCIALKCIHPNSSPHRILNELEHLRALGGENNVAGILGGIRRQSSFIAILPYFVHDDFKFYMATLDADGIRSYMRELLRALQHVHSKGIIHRDVKPRNFLYSVRRKQGLLIDFGLAQPRQEWEPALLSKGVRWDGSKVAPLEDTFGERERKRRKRARPRLEKIRRKKQKADRAGTPGFRAPEVLLMSLEQTPAIDIWSAGVIFLSILSARYPVFPPPPRGRSISSDAMALSQRGPARRVRPPARCGGMQQESARDPLASAWGRLSRSYH